MESIQARSQKFAVGGGGADFESGVETPAAGGRWGLGAKVQGSGGFAPSAQKFCIFLQK